MDLDQSMDAFFLLLLHAVLMLASFGALLTVSAVVACFCRRRPVDVAVGEEPPSPSPDAWWFRRHTQLHLACVILGGLGLICAFVGVESRPEISSAKRFFGHLDSMHAGIGLFILFVVGFLQPELGLAETAAKGVAAAGATQIGASLLICRSVVSSTKPLELKLTPFVRSYVTRAAKQRFSKKCQFKAHSYIGRAALVLVVYNAHLGRDDSKRADDLES
jgi:hypothetical protein